MHEPEAILKWMYRAKKSIKKDLESERNVWLLEKTAFKLGDADQSIWSAGVSSAANRLVVTMEKIVQTGH